MKFHDKTRAAQKMMFNCAPNSYIRAMVSYVLGPWSDGTDLLTIPVDLHICQCGCECLVGGVIDAAKVTAGEPIPDEDQEFGNWGEAEDVVKMFGGLMEAAGLDAGERAWFVACMHKRIKWDIDDPVLPESN